MKTSAKLVVIMLALAALLGVGHAADPSPAKRADSSPAGKSRADATATQSPGQSSTTGTFPFPIDFTLTKDELDQYSSTDISSFKDDTEPAARAFDVTSYGPEIATTNTQTSVYNLAKIGNWPEYKTMWKVKCKFGVCTKVPVAYRRQCTKYAYVKVTYPIGQEQEIKDCIAGSALAAAVTAVISGGAAGAAVFEQALQACLEARGHQWAREVKVGAGWDSQCGGWTPY